jgi:lipid II:glycine glycyltransferase (peptidoglycan interpeptide bridge formation enzyme)
MSYMCGQSTLMSRETGLNPLPDPFWQVEVDRVTPAEWSSMLDLFDDANLYQTWSYGAIRWGRKNLSHLVLKRNDEVVGITQLRIVRPTSLKFGMAYLRWGPICHRRGTELDSEVFARMADALHQEYVVKRRLLLHILPNAFVGSARAEAFQSAFANFAMEPSTTATKYRTFVLDVAPSIEELRKNLDKKWRNQLSRSERNGLNVVAGSGTDAYRRFSTMYGQMRDRKTFETTVDVEEFGRIQQDLPENQRMRILICERNGKPVAGVAASAMGDSAIYLLGATSDDGLDAKGSYLLQWTWIQWLKENGVRWYDLGGIDPDGNPGVYHFKKGFSGADVCQLTPFVACENAFSFAVVKAGRVMERAVRRLSNFQGGLVAKSAI